MTSRWLPRTSGTLSSSKAPTRHDSLTAYLVVRTRANGAAVLRDDIRAIKCIVEAAPPRVCGIRRISRIGERHDELGPGNYRDLVIDISGADSKILAFGQNISDSRGLCAWDPAKRAKQYGV